MTKPFAARSHEQATNTGYGDATRTKGHTAVGLYVVARNLDPGADTLDITLHTGFKDYTDTIRTTPMTGVNLSLSVGDFTDTEGDGEYEAYISASNLPVEYVRAYISSFSDSANSDLEVDTYLLCANSSGTGHRFAKDGSP